MLRVIQVFFSFFLFPFIACNKGKNIKAPSRIAVFISYGTLVRNKNAPVCPRHFYHSHPDKHSDFDGNGCCRGFPPLFPYPRTAMPSDNRARACPPVMRCVFLFFLSWVAPTDILTQKRIKSNSFMPFIRLFIIDAYLFLL